MIPKGVKDFVISYANQLAILAILFFAFNFALADWSLNPIEDLLYVRTSGYILPANHVSSAFSVVGVALYYAVKEHRQAAKWLFVSFSTASIHEFILDALNVPAMLAAHSLGYTITFRWWFWLSVFLVPGIILANREQRITLSAIALFCLVYISAWVVMASAFNIDTYTILRYAPGPAYHDFWPNFFEVSSWVIPSSFWFLLYPRSKRVA